MANKLRYALPITAAFLFMGLIGTIQAAPKGDGGGDPEILEVIPDYDFNSLRIYGNKLSDGIFPYSVVVSLKEHLT